MFLALPWVTSSGQPTPLVDAFFTSVSAASVTGLSVVDTLEHWNWWGQFVILVLTQTGGLGFMVGASILLQMLRRGAGAYTLRDELLLKDGAPALSIQEAVFLAGRIVRFTFVVEIIGAAALAVWFGTAGGLRPLECALERPVLRGCGILQCRLRSHGGLSIDSTGSNRRLGQPRVDRLDPAWCTLVHGFRRCCTETVVAVAGARLQDRADIERRAPGGGHHRLSGS